MPPPQVLLRVAFFRVEVRAQGIDTSYALVYPPATEAVPFQGFQAPSCEEARQAQCSQASSCEQTPQAARVYGLEAARLPPRLVARLSPQATRQGMVWSVAVGLARSHATAAGGGGTAAGGRYGRLACIAGIFADMRCTSADIWAGATSRSCLLCMAKTMFTSSGGTRNFAMGR